MKLFTNGCSFTWGAEILQSQFGIMPFDNISEDSIKYETFRKEHVWAYFLKEKFHDVEKYDNLARGGSSNKRIVRTTLDYFLNLIDKGIRVDDYVAVIQWTDMNRTEVYDESINDYQYVNHRGVFHPAIKEQIHTNQPYKDFVKGRYTLDEQNFKDEFRRWVLSNDNLAVEGERYPKFVDFNKATTEVDDFMQSYFRSHPDVWDEREINEENEDEMINEYIELTEPYLERALYIKSGGISGRGIGINQYAAKLGRELKATLTGQSGMGLKKTYADYVQGRLSKKQYVDTTERLIKEKLSKRSATVSDYEKAQKYQKKMNKVKEEVKAEEKESKMREMKAAREAKKKKAEESKLIRKMLEENELEPYDYNDHISDWRELVFRPFVFGLDDEGNPNILPLNKGKEENKARRVSNFLNTKNYLMRWWNYRVDKKERNLLEKPNEDIIGYYTLMAEKMLSMQTGKGRVRGGGPFGKSISSGKKIPTFQDWMTGNKATDMMLGKGKPKILPFQDLIPDNKNIRLVGSGNLKIEKMGDKELFSSLNLNVASKRAGNTGVSDIINAIIDEMFRRKLINKGEHRRLWYDVVDA